jgi:hypothetical protein
LVSTLFIAAPEAGQYEQPPRFQASQVLPPDLLRNPNYTVANQVGLDNFQYVFQVDTAWGCKWAWPPCCKPTRAR